MNVWASDEIGIMEFWQNSLTGSSPVCVHLKKGKSMYILTVSRFELEYEYGGPTGRKEKIEISWAVSRDKALLEKKIDDLNKSAMFSECVFEIEPIPFIE